MYQTCTNLRFSGAFRAPFGRIAESERRHSVRWRRNPQGSSSPTPWLPTAKTAISARNSAIVALGRLRTMEPENRNARDVDLCRMIVSRPAPRSSATAPQRGLPDGNLAPNADRPTATPGRDVSAPNPAIAGRLPTETWRPGIDLPHPEALPHAVT